MRQFGATGSRLWNLSREAKIVYTWFCVMSLLALGSSLLLYEDMVGPSLRGGRLSRVQKYYTGEGEAGPSEHRPPGGPPGPDIALPDDEVTAKLTVAVPYRKLLEVTHFHLFTVPVFLLIISHLFMLSGAAPRTKLAWITGGWVSSFLHLLSPWLIRYGGSGFAFAYPMSGAGLFISGTVLSLYPAVAMWRTPQRGRSRPTPEQEAD